MFDYRPGDSAARTELELARWMNRRITTEESEERPGMTVLDVSKAACAGCDTPAMKAAFPCAFTDGTGPSLSRNA